MILSDTDIIAALADGTIVIEPLDDCDMQIQPASVDLRLFDGLKTQHGRPRGWVLHPGDFALGCTIERVRVPNDMVCRVEGRSSLGRVGLAVHITAGFCDPGFDGQITLEFANLGEEPVTLSPGMRICQIVFHRLSSPAARPYGYQRGSKYQYQTGPTVAQKDYK